MEEIGRLLRQAREQRGESMAEVEAATKIRVKYLEALESGNPEVIPGEVFIKGFLRTYGNYLGLDGPALVERYKVLCAQAAAPAGHPAAPPALTRPAGGAAAISPAQPPATAPSARVPAPARPVPVREAAVASQAPRAGGARYSPAVLWGAGLLVLAVALGMGLVKLGGKGQPNPPGAAQPSPPVSSQPAPAPVPVPAQAPAPAPQVKVEKGSPKLVGDSTVLPVAVSGADQISLQVKATERCWLQVLADGKPGLVYEGTLEKGEAKQWQASGLLRIRVGYPLGLQATINGQTFSPIQGTDSPLWLEVSLTK